MIFATLAGGCGSPSNGTPGKDGSSHPDAGSTNIDAFVAVAAPSPPYEESNPQGGPVLQNPKLVVVSFNGDPNAAKLTRFAEWFPTSSLFTTELGEYGVGQGTFVGDGASGGSACNAATGCVLTASLGSQVSDNTLQRDVDNAINGGQLPAPDPANETLYVILVPQGVTETGNAGTSCQDFLGYHFVDSAMGFPYAIVPFCSNGIPGVANADVQTIAASHEISEASTDPQINAWDIFGVPGGGEVGDLCAFQYLTQAVGSDTFYVQREYSTQAAVSGHNPCVPAPGAWFGVAPTQGANAVVQVTAGSSASIDGIAFATAPIQGAILPSAVPLDQFTSVSLDKQTYQPGQHATITVSVPAGTPPGGQYGFSIFSSTQFGGDVTEWPVTVQVN
jgi:hypothetical protein